MWLSSTAQMALRAVLYLAAQEPGELTPVGTIASAIDLPRNYLGKILDALRRAGVVEAVRGPGGGFRLAQAADTLHLAEVVAPFLSATRRCLLGRPTCGDANPCPAHHQWAAVASVLERFLTETTVAGLARQPEARARLSSPSPGSRRAAAR